VDGGTGTDQYWLARMESCLEAIGRGNGAAVGRVSVRDPDTITIDPKMQMGFGDGPAGIDHGQQLLYSFTRLCGRIASQKDRTAQLHVLSVIYLDPQDRLCPCGARAHLGALDVVVGMASKAGNRRGRLLFGLGLRRHLRVDDVGLLRGRCLLLCCRRWPWSRRRTPLVGVM